MMSYNHYKLSMKIILDTKNNIIADVCHDTNGNVFIKINDDNIHFLTIDRDNNLEFVKIENMDIFIDPEETKLKYKKIKNFADENSLRGKIKSQFDEDDNEIEYSDEEEDDETKHYYSCHPENRLYYENDDYVNPEENMEYTDEVYDQQEFTFSKSGDEVLECLTKKLEIPATYDTFVIDDLHSMVLLTMQCNEKSEYRVSYLTSGLFTLNIIGSNIKTFKPRLDENNTIHMEHIQSVAVI